jgi:hypothetical protein
MAFSDKHIGRLMPEIKAVIEASANSSSDSDKIKNELKKYSLKSCNNCVRSVSSCDVIANLDCLLVFFPESEKKDDGRWK